MTAIVDAVRASLAARAARARALAETHTAASDLLTFAAGLADVQQQLLVRADAVVRLDDTGDVAPGKRLQRALDTIALAGSASTLSTWVIATAPGPLRGAACTLDESGSAGWRTALDANLTADGPDRTLSSASEATTAFLCDALVQPFAEVVARDVAANAGGAHSPAATATCPGCGRVPVVGVLRERGHGAGRALVCGRCLTEWASPRVVCPSCGGLDVERLPVFRADDWPAVRLDACDACHTYLKSVDLTIDGRAVAIVDDLATVALDLWAVEQGYQRLHSGLLQL